MSVSGPHDFSPPDWGPSPDFPSRGNGSTLAWLVVVAAVAFGFLTLCLLGVLLRTAMVSEEYRAGQDIGRDAYVTSEYDAQSYCDSVAVFGGMDDSSEAYRDFVLGCVDGAGY